MRLMPFAFLWLKHYACLKFGSHLHFLTSWPTLSSIWWKNWRYAGMLQLVGVIQLKGTWTYWRNMFITRQTSKDAFGYMYDETFGFCTKYFRWYPHIRCQMWVAEEQKIEVGEILVSKGKRKKLTIEELKVIHEYIITNSTTTDVAYR